MALPSPTAPPKLRDTAQDNADLTKQPFICDAVSCCHPVHCPQHSTYPPLTAAASLPPTAPLDQQLDRLRLAVTRSIVQRRVLVVVDNVQRRLRGDEGLGALNLAVATCKMQRGAALLVRLVRLGTLLEQALDGLNIACEKCHAKCTSQRLDIAAAVRLAVMCWYPGCRA